MEDIILIGGGGHCNSVIDVIRKINLYNIVGIIDLRDNIGKYVNGIKIIGTDEELPYYKMNGIKNAFITIGSVGNVLPRRNMYSLLKKLGFKLPIIIDASASIADSAVIAEGTFIGKKVIVNSGTKIGKNCILNSGAIIEHDCIIEEFVHISPGSVVCGGVQVGSNTHIGANSTIIQYKNIGKNVMVGAGSVVVNNILDNTKAYGVPCKIINKI